MVGKSRIGYRFWEGYCPSLAIPKRQLIASGLNEYEVTNLADKLESNSVKTQLMKTLSSNE